MQKTMTQQLESPEDDSLVFSSDGESFNYDKTCNFIQNLICLCRNCHLLTNLNREYWTKLFQEKLSKLYGYNYNDNQDIILEVKNEI